MNYIWIGFGVGCYGALWWTLGIIVGKLTARHSFEDRQRLREANWRAGDRRR